MSPCEVAPIISPAPLLHHPVSQFKAAMHVAGLEPPEVIEADGKLHRFATNGKARDDAGWYVYYGDGIPAGAFGDWRSGVSETWLAEVGRTLTPAEEAGRREKVEAMRREREAEETERHAEAAVRAAEILKSTTAATNDHPYLVRRGIKVDGLRMHQGALVVPMYDGSELRSLQFIAEDGAKRYLTGGQVQGCYFIIGKPDNVLCIAEGFATAASIHEATGHAVAASFSAGNLKHVASALRGKFPAAELILCADDDAFTPGNPGLTKAREAAHAVGGLLAIPDFGSDRPQHATDFNDMHLLHGPEAVRDSVLIKTGVTGVTSSNDAGFGVTPDGLHGVTGVTKHIPGKSERPCYRVFDDWIEHGGKKYRSGVWYFGIKGDKKGQQTEIETYICSPLHVDAVTFDHQSNNFGRLLRFRNTLGRWREWSMPMELLRGAGDELRGELLSMGVEIDPAAKAMLGQYLQSAHPKRRVHCALQVGWCDDSFVLPDAVIGPRASGVIFQSGERGHEEYTTGGTQDGWKTEIASLAVGNPILLLAISASFVGPLLAKCNAESGGIHLTGDSSTGKTSAIEAACATWGGANYRRSWRATANGLEGAASMFNDCLLALDEISECEPREVGQVVYMLGKAR